jgi:VanZ family protein
MKRISRWLPSMIWMLVIFWLSHQTGSELNGMFPWLSRLFPWIDSFNFGHFIAYFILALFYWYGLSSPTVLAKALVVVLCLLYGITDEYHQSFIADRMPDLIDIRNDTIGALLAMLVVSFPPIQKWLRSRRIP